MHSIPIFADKNHLAWAGLFDDTSIIYFLEELLVLVSGLLVSLVLKYLDKAECCRLLFGLRIHCTVAPRVEDLDWCMFSF